MNTLVKAKTKETDDILWIIKDAPKRYIEGIEFVKVKRNENDTNSYYIRRDSLVTSWR